MGIIFIGDRAVGKSNLVLSLTSQQCQRVKVTNATEEQLELLASGEKLSPTQGIKSETLEMSVKLLAPVKLQVQWLDTAGEINRIEWQQDPENVKPWREFKERARQSKGVVVILPPYREIGNGITDLEIIQAHGVPTETQWVNRFERWANFFLAYCPNVEHVVLCINKADLFCDLEAEANKLAYNPNGLTMDWVERNNYIINKYFRPIKSAIGKISKNRDALPVRCFITSIHSRTLLELPWIYLAAYLRN
jgi:hypothetical protein